MEKQIKRQKDTKKKIRKKQQYEVKKEVYKEYLIYLQSERVQKSESAFKAEKMKIFADKQHEINALPKLEKRVRAYDAEESCSEESAFKRGRLASS